MSPDISLQADVAAIASKIHHDPQSQQFGLSDDDFAHFAVEMGKSRGAAETDEIAAHLIALCLKYERLAREHTQTAISQFMVLMALALGDAQKTKDALAQAGIEVSDDVSALIGAKGSKLPLSARPKEGVSLFDFRLKDGHEPED